MGKDQTSVRLFCLLCCVYMAHCGNGEPGGGDAAIDADADRSGDADDRDGDDHDTDADSDADTDSDSVGDADPASDADPYVPDADREADRDSDYDRPLDADTGDEPDGDALNSCTGQVGARCFGAYPDQGAFLVAAQDWREVLALVPMATWHASTAEELAACLRPYGGAAGVCSYPTLIVHAEEAGTDMDPIMSFLDRLEATEVVTVGSLPEDAEAALGHMSLRRIDDPLHDLWGEVDQVVLVEDDYEAALMAAPYAALLGAPLLIEGYNDVHLNEAGTEVLCVGEPTAACDEQLGLDQLTSTYLQATSTDLVLVTDPGDLDSFVGGAPFALERTRGTVGQMYGNLSLAAPFLAAAKEQLLLTFDGLDSAPEAVDGWLEMRLDSVGIEPSYITVVAAPSHLPHARRNFNYYRQGTAGDIWTQVDGVLYGDSDGDFYQDRRIGRVFSFTVSGTSAYVARALFHNRLPQSSSFATLSSFDRFFADGLQKSFFVDQAYESLGLERHSAHCDARNNFDAGLYEGHALLAYAGHGSSTGTQGGFTTGTYRAEQIWMPSTMVVADACLTCSYDNASTSSSLFCAEMIRRGAIGFVGAVEATSANGRIPTAFLLHLAKGADLGTAMRDAANIHFAGHSLMYSPFMTLIGDPTLDLEFPGDDSLDLVQLHAGELEGDGQSWILPVTVSFEPTITTAQTGAWHRWDQLLDVTTAPYYAGDSVFRATVYYAHRYADPPDSDVELEFFDAAVDVVARFHNPDGLSLAGIRSATRTTGGTTVDISDQFTHSYELAAATNSEDVTFVKLRLSLGDQFVLQDTEALPAVGFDIEVVFQ